MEAKEPTSRAKTISAAIVAAVVLVVGLSPTLILGERPSALGLVLTGAGVASLGLLMRRASRGAGRTTGTALAIFGAALAFVGVGLIVLLLAAWS